jgi:hypothetical protein
MRYIRPLGALLLCLFSTQYVRAEACGEAHACLGNVAPAPIGGSAATIADQPERCPGLPIEVMTSSTEERRLACSAAADAVRLLSRCSITPKRPLLVEIMSEVRHPFSGPIFGMFDIARERVLVTVQANIPALVEDTPYASLPLQDFYKSLIVHEIVHGIMHQNLQRKAATHAAYEYPAYALQMESLPADVRATFLQSFDQAALRSNTLFNDSVLFFDPYFFAARAYHHYKSAPDACEHLTGLLSGEVAFIAPPM